jgi:formylglycine-generating enzyme required for sulfatase activity
MALALLSGAFAGEAAPTESPVPTLAPLPPLPPGTLAPLPPLPTPPPMAEKYLRVDVGEGVMMDFVLIPAGDSVMGSPPTELGRRSDESPRHKVTLSRPFYMGKTEVTQVQYEQLMPGNPSEEKGGFYPVARITWGEAVQFCKKLTEKQAKAGRLKAGEEYRLPTEAEWECACRAGTDRRFSFGGVDDELVQYGWCIENSDEKPHVVALKKPNPWGLYDVHGNVLEWCLDWYALHYPAGNQTDPTGPAQGTTRVARGGCWMSDLSQCRSAARFSFRPDSRSYMIGFRVMRTIAEELAEPPKE